MPHSTRWTPKEDKLLGTARDDVIAKRIGRTRGAVALRRFRLDIAAPGTFRYSRRTRWGPTEISLFLRCSDAEVARISGRSLKDVKAKRADLSRAHR
jgi:hypothetical protein